MLLHTHALVLSRQRLEESSSIVRLYSAARGRISAVAKAARRPASRFGSALEPGSLVVTTIYFKENRDLHLLSSAELIKSHAELRETGELWAHLAVILEMAEKLTATEEPNQAKFILLTQALDNLPTSPQSVTLAFLLRFTLMSGFGLSLDSCLVCGAKLEANSWYLPDMGGMVCERCYQFRPEALPIGGELRGIMSFLIRTPLTNSGKVHLNAKSATEIENLLTLHLRSTAEISLKTPSLSKILEGT